MAPDHLTRIQGIGLALGSLFGAGLIFLPSLLTQKAGPDAVAVWAGGLGLSLPLLWMFADLMERVPGDRGIEGFIDAGLGPVFAGAVPVFFLVGVVLGVPSTFLVPGTQLGSLTGGGLAVQVATVLVMLSVSAGTTLLGVRSGTRLQTGISVAVGVASVAVVAFTFPMASPHYPQLMPTFAHPDRWLAGVMVSFFAFGGLENMSFIAAEFKNPRRDYLVVMSVSMALYTVLLVALTAHYQLLIPAEAVDPVKGLFQLAGFIQPEDTVQRVMALLAVAVCQLNINAWFWGMSRMIAAAARAGTLPGWLRADTAEREIRKGVAVQVVLAGVGLSLFLADPDILATLFSGVSSILVTLYLMAALAYARLMAGWPRRLLGLATAAGLAAALLAGGALLPLAAFALSVLLRSRFIRPVRGRGHHGPAGR